MREGRPLRFWLLSAYRADSHAAWADGLVRRRSEIEWRRFELPGRHFAWRLRGAPLSWLDAFDGPMPDAAVVTSMVDLSTLRGLHPGLARVPVLLYMHENQFAYPSNPRQLTSIDARMVQVYAALSADRIAFNSDYNRRSFLDGVEALLARMPDHVPTGVVDRIAARSSVLPVPVEPVPGDPRRDPLRIVWNHRWEYDKAPERFADAILGLARRGLEFRLALLGPRHRDPPEALVRLREALPDRIVADGALPVAAYHEALGQASIAVSTAIHEFQGLGMLEAASAGCIPLVPDALCYPELYPPEYRYDPDRPGALEERLAAWLSGPRPDRFDSRAWAPEVLDARWCEALHDLASNARGQATRG